ncbi:MAG: hypothetical protein PHX53_00165 [Syntrophales bacterium]|nr:hypothetical protein [Syntrophales bacterium]
MPWPNEKTNWVDGVTELDAWWFNAMEDYVGEVGSSDPASLTYKLTNPAQENPGHRHTAAAFNGGNVGDVFSRAEDAWAPMTPDAAGLVAKAGDQTIAGKKTFATIPEVGADPANGDQLARKAYVDSGIAAEASARDAAIATEATARTAAIAAEADARAAADATHDTAIAGKVARTGDTMTGDLGFDGETADRAIQQGRRTTADSAGRNLTVSAGGATEGATNRAGGTLKLQPGVSTGAGESGVEIYGCPAGAPGVNDNPLALMLKVLGNKMGFFGAAPVVKPAGLTARLTTLTFVDPGVPDYDIVAPIQNTGWGFATADEFKTVMSVIANLQTRLGQLETRQQGLGLLS